MRGSGTSLSRFELENAGLRNGRFERENVSLRNCHGRVWLTRGAAGAEPAVGGDERVERIFGKFVKMICSGTEIQG